jgi:hypothetical protein
MVASNPGNEFQVEWNVPIPSYDRNLNTGGVFGEDVRGKTTVNTIFHDELRRQKLYCRSCHNHQYVLF